MRDGGKRGEELHDLQPEVEVVYGCPEPKRADVRVGRP
jgi:hypothetical protein